MTEVSDQVLTRTRQSLHRVAEHVLAAARKRATGEISLLAGVGGVRTPPLPDGRVLALLDADIAVLEGADVRRRPLTTVGAAAAFAGTEPGFPWTKHPPATDPDPETPLSVDVDAARVLAAWFALGDTALRQLGAELVGGDAPVPVVYPEHFDLAITVDEVNYGVSPGDTALPAPYLYVGPWDGPPAEDHFWNASFGASTTIADVHSPADALAFFREGRRRRSGPSA